jgi:hypothetical protein
MQGSRGQGGNVYSWILERGTSKSEEKHENAGLRPERLPTNQIPELAHTYPCGQYQEIPTAALNGKPSLCRRPPRQVRRRGNGRCRLRRQSRGSDTPAEEKSRRRPYLAVTSALTHVVCHEHEHEEEGYEDDHSVEQRPVQPGNLTDNNRPIRPLVSKNAS